MPEEKPHCDYYIQLDMFTVLNDGNIGARFTPVGGPDTTLNVKYSELSAGNKVIYDNFIAMVKTL